MDKNLGSRLAEFLIAAAGTALLLWAEAPDWQKKQVTMAVSRGLSRLAARPHHAAGHAGMTCELRAGAEDAGTLPYAAARCLGHVRELARRTYERLSA
jgi:hypothetical protein